MGHDELRHPEVVDEPDGSATLTSWRRYVPHEDQWSVALLAAGLISVAVFGLAADLQLPWLRIDLGEGATDRLEFWDDLRQPEAVAYEQRLLVWPLVAYAGMGLAGALLVARCYRPVGDEAVVRSAGAWAAGFAGFILALTGTRWLGFYLARLGDSGPSIVHLHAAPYINLGVGLVVLGVATWAIVNDVRHAGPLPPVFRWAAASAGLAALALLTLPLVPFAETRFFGGVTFWTDEFTLALIDHQGSGDGSGAPEALARARLALWGVLYASIASAVAVRHQSARRMRRFRRLEDAVMLNVLFVAAGVWFSYRFYDALPDLFRNTQLAYNFVLPVALAGLLATWGLYVRARFFE